MANTTTVSDIKNDLVFLLKNALPDESFDDYKIEIVGTSEKGDGYLGDIYFVNLTSNKRNYNFVLKCGKPSEALRKSFPVKNAYDQEIYLYNTVIPALQKFEIERNAPVVFNNIPKCYGTFTCQGKEVIVLENLKTLGYELWDKKQPLPRDYLETVLKLYGHWHAISAAMQDQEPKRIEQLVKPMFDVWGDFCKAENITKIYSNIIEDVLKIWKNDMDEDILSEWRNLKEHAESYVLKLRKKSKTLNVITHGDCWNNNYMFKTVQREGAKEIDVTMLDWQLSGFSSPVIDISYFLYCCISEDDLEDFDDLLKLYYDSFAEHLQKLGSDPDKIYTYSNLLDDWKIYARINILQSLVIFNITNADKGDVVDLTKIAENGENMSEVFSNNIKNVDSFKKRSKCIIKHAVERHLIKLIKLSDL